MPWILRTISLRGGRLDLRSFIGSPERVEGASVEYEIARSLRKNPQTLYFSKPTGFDFDVVGNVITSREDLYRALGTTREAYIKHVLSAYRNPIDPSIVDTGVCQEKECSIYDLPILRHFEKDAGKYITSGIVIAKDPEYGGNASIHRLLLHEANRLGIRIVPRHLYEYFKRSESRGEDLEIAIAIGVHPLILYSAAFSPPLGYNELALAGGLMGQPLELVKCKTVDIEVPASAEIVIEGKILSGERIAEGPFADVTGTYDRIRHEPVVEVGKVTHRKNAVYHALLPSGMEHRLFMGMPQEPQIFKSLQEVSPVKNVCLSDGGRNWLHCVVSLGEGKFEIEDVIAKVFEAHPSVKHVVVVNGDIDIFDPDEVEYAISTRFQAHKDAYIYKNMRGSTLDPSTDGDGKTTKVGIDATIPPGKEEDYEFAEIP